MLLGTVMGVSYQDDACYLVMGVINSVTMVKGVTNSDLGLNERNICVTPGYPGLLQ